MTREQKKKQKPIWKGLWLLTLLVLMLAGCSGQAEETATEAYDPYNHAQSLTAVLKTMNLDDGTMTLVDINTGLSYDLLYNNGVDVRNKYDEIMSGTLLEEGEILDITYNEDNNKLLEMKINPDAWEVREISGLEINRVDRQAQILNQSYNYTDDLVVLSAGTPIGINEICKEDQLTARGYGSRLCSLTVDLGHGYVKLENYDTYIGGMIEIGYNTIVPVTEDMLLTVREGTYKLKITKGEHSGYKNIVVNRDEESVISLQELQIAPDPVGMLYFDVTPVEARVMIDGETIDTGQTIELTYGKHQIRITAEGYETKAGYITVNAAYKLFTIELSATDDDTNTSAAATTTASAASDGTTAAGSTEKTTSSTEDGAATTETKTTGNTVTISKPVGAYCYVDGDLKGTVPVTFDKTVGSHVVTFSMTGCLVKSYTIQCQDNGKDDTYSFDALPTYSSVLFEEN